VLLVRYDGDRQPPRAQRPAPPRDDHIRPRAATMPSQRRSSRGRSLPGPAGVLRYPSTSLLRATPGSASVIPPATEADLPNRQGPCLRNSSPSTPLRRQKCLFSDRGNETSSSIKAVTTHKSDDCQASSQPGLYHPARPRHHPPPTAVRDGKRSNSFPSRPTPRWEPPWVSKRELSGSHISPGDPTRRLRSELFTHCDPVRPSTLLGHSGDGVDPGRMPAAM